MCGFAGLLRPGADVSLDWLEHQVEAMTATLEHRGPDDAGAWSDVETGLVLGHRRLSIIDLSPAGHQPMTSADGRWVLAYNGELYNTAELRARVRSWGTRLRGHSDTEVLLELMARLGPRGAAEATNGMFAFAAWDRRDRTLHLGRDRLGEKPLYYGLHEGGVVFASELKALHGLEGLRPEIDRSALQEYFRYSYVRAPRSIYRDVFKVEPATIVTVQQSTMRPTIARYWSALDAAVAGRAATTHETSAELEQLLTDAIDRRMVSDVPIGALLSGGVDSASMVALMQQRSDRPVRTFTIGFDDERFDEAPHAKKVAQHLGCDHTELYLGPDEVMQAIPRVSAVYDEPFADSSQLPTMLVCELARRSVTVALGGDGADEVFGGYNRYVWWNDLWDRTRGTPTVLRRLGAAAVGAVPPGGWNAASSAIRRLRPTSRLADRRLAERAVKGAALLAANTPRDAYEQLLSVWTPPTPVLGGGPGCESSIALGANAPFAEQMMYADLVDYLPNDILTKVDRASMSTSLEVRAPFLDHRLVEAAWRLPLTSKVNRGVGKIALRQILYRHVPRELVDRPKAGFALPVGEWLRGPLRPWAEDLLDRRRLDLHGYVASEPIRHAWKRHLAGDVGRDAQVWTALMFEAWLDRWHRS
jgi:asparagine synthase (glutamine-hydrolysing)